MSKTEISDQKYRILMVDDDPDDIFLVGRGLDEATSKIEFCSASGGEEMFDWLNKQARKLPDLILLDINMPRMNGYEILTKMKSVSAWARIPIYIFSTSDHSADRTQCMELGASGFVTKFASIAALSDWLTEVETILQRYEPAKALH